MPDRLLEGDWQKQKEITLATQKQIEANRKNAKRSTGPKSAKGKARVSKNAIRHGVCSINPVVHDLENLDTWKAFEKGIRDSLAPVGLLEETLAARVTLCLWRLRRTASYETGATRQAVEWKKEADEDQRYACHLESLIEQKENELQTCQDPTSRSQLQATIRQWRRHAEDKKIACIGRIMLDGVLPNPDSLGNIVRYEAHLSPQMFQSLHELQRLQAARNEGESADTPPVLDGETPIGE